MNPFVTFAAKHWVWIVVAVLVAAMAVQSRRLDSANAKIADQHQALLNATASLNRATAALGRDVHSASNQTVACTQAATDAVHAGEAIERITHAPVVISPVDHCPQRSVVGADQLCVVFGDCPTPPASVPH